MTMGEHMPSEPSSIIAPTFLATVSIGSAKPTPEKVPLVDRIAVFTPTTAPENACIHMRVGRFRSRSDFETMRFRPFSCESRHYS